MSSSERRKNRPARLYDPSSSKFPVRDKSESESAAPAGYRKFRQVILSEAMDALADRGDTYGDPHENFTCYRELVKIYQQFSNTAGIPNGPIHDSVMHVVLLKVARIATGKYHPDNYVDGAGYFAIAGEEARHWDMGKP